MDPTPPAEILSQSEVENLLAHVAEEENTVIVHAGGSKKLRRSRDSIQPFDFRHPPILSQAELRRLRIRHEEFARALSARLSLYLRMEVTLQVTRFQTMLYRKLTDSFAAPTHLTMFRAEPLPGVCLLEIPPRLALPIVDRLLGGPAQVVNPDHELTEIELALLQQAVQVITGELADHWRPVKELKPVTLGYENNGRFLQTAPHDTVMLVVSMETKIGECVETIQFGFPYYTLEPLIRALGPCSTPAATPTPGKADAKPTWNPAFDTIRVPVSAAWVDLELTARELAGLQVGHVLELSPASADQVSVRLADVPRFRGRLGTQAGKWAVQLTEDIKK